MVYRVLSLSLVAVALVLFIGAPGLAQEKERPKVGDRPAGLQGDTHEGTVVSTAGNKLVMKGKEGADAKEHTHTVAATARVTCDGRECKLDDLKPGMKIRVTTAKGNKNMAIRVEALDKNKDFPRGTGTTTSPRKTP